MIYFDTETCGFHGPTVLIQYAYDDGPIVLHEVWRSPIEETMQLIEDLCYHEGGVCGFNLAFDWFHLCQTYTTLNEMLTRGIKATEIPLHFVDEYAEAEAVARDGPCLKPVTALDLMLHARKGPYQSTMDREDIRIKKVPTALAYVLAAELTDRIQFKQVYFARQSDARKRWTVMDIRDDMNNIDPEFKDIVLRFRPSSALKALAFDALELEEDEILKFTTVELGDNMRPVEVGYAPFALAIGQPEKWNKAWPMYIEAHVYHWGFNRLARKYAEDDVDYTRRLHKYFSADASGATHAEARDYANHAVGEYKDIPPGDRDSILACMVGAVRWRGFKVDINKIKEFREEAIAKKESAKYQFSSTEVCVRYLEDAMTDMEKMVIRVGGKITTRKIILEDIAKWREEEICPKCEGMGCDNCEGGLVTIQDRPHEAAKRAREILDYRQIGKRIELYDKLIKAGRFHASFKVIGALSSRMSGADGLNPQGIPHEKEIRACFPLAWSDLVLCGGDFDGFEVCLADAKYGDPNLRTLLKSGKKIHGLFGTKLFPPRTYEEILATDGLPGEKDLYGRSKNGVFAILYGGEPYTLATRVGVPEEIGEVAYQEWVKDFPVWGQKRREIFDKFCSMRQPGGIGSKVEWHEPHDYAESLMGFRRYFTLENRVVKELFNLAEKPPRTLANCNIKVKRRDRIQAASGAVRSALFAAAFQIQAANMRAAANHEIQSTGADLTKELQVRLWSIQPVGVNNWFIEPMNIHDEIMAPAREEVHDKVRETVDTFVEEYRELVPLLGISWKNGIDSWAAKK